MSAACGPYCMSCGMSETTIASTTRTPTFESSMQEVRDADEHRRRAAPVMYIRLRPILSERCPKNGTLKSDSAAATITALVRKPLLKPRSSVP